MITTGFDFVDLLKDTLSTYHTEDTIAIRALEGRAMFARMYGAPMTDEDVIGLARDLATALKKNPDFAAEEAERRLQMIHSGLEGMAQDDDYDDAAKGLIRDRLLTCTNGSGAYTPSVTKFVDYIKATTCPKHVRVDPVGNVPLALYLYKDGVYQSYTDQMMGGRIKALFDEYDMKDMFRMKFANEVVAQCGLSENVYYPDHINAGMDRFVNFRNGLLDLDTMSLRPHTPDVFSTIQLPCRWTGKPSPAPVFNRYLETLAGGNQEVIRFIKQFMGAIFTNIPMATFKKTPLLYGPGDTGKSKIGWLLCAILGPVYSTAIEMDLLTKNQFATSQLFGKRFASCNDMTYARLKDLSIFKQFTGGDPIRIEFKNKGATSTVWPGGMLWVCNDRPKFGGDQGRHVYERLIPIPCDHVIPKEKRDGKLPQKLLAETEGIVYECITQFANDVYSMGDNMTFTEPSFIADERRKYAADNNHDIEFFQTYMRPSETTEDVNNELTVTTYTEAYTQWHQNQYGIEYIKKPKALFNDLATYLDKPVDQIKVRRTDGRTYLAGYTPSIDYTRSTTKGSRDLDFINQVLRDLDLDPSGYMLKVGDPALRATAESVYTVHGKQEA